jgi:hypothetical protein
MPSLEFIAELRHVARSGLSHLVERVHDWRWSLSRRPLSMVLLRDQQPLSESELRRANSIIDWIEQVVAARPAYLERHRLSPAIHFPQAIWALDHGEGLYDGLRAVLSRDPRILNHLRLWSQQFTGYRLLSMESAEGRPFPRPEEIGPAADQRLSSLASAPDQWVGRYLEVAAKLPPALRISPPRRFGEIGWNVGGRTVSFDTYVYLERLALMHDCGMLERLRRIAAAGRTPYLVEIGGGFGGLAYYLSALIPQARIVIVDLPESLIYSSLYLSLLRPERTHVYANPGTAIEPLVPDTPGCTFVPNYLFDTLIQTGAKFDLAINTLSMSEMDASQVDYYCQGLNQLLGDDGVFFEQNHNNEAVGQLHAKTVIARHFGHCHEVYSQAAKALTQGRTHLWTRQAQPSLGERPARRPARSSAPDAVRKFRNIPAPDSRAA